MKKLLPYNKHYYKPRDSHRGVYSNNQKSIILMNEIFKKLTLKHTKL